MIVAGKKTAPLFDAKKIAARVQQLGEEISKAYAGQEVVMVGVLKGSFIFLADLARAIKTPVAIEFMAVRSYEGTASTGKLTIDLDLKTEIAGKHVILVEDIVDTGHTVAHLLQHLQKKNPKSLKLCCLLSKPEVHQGSVKLDFIGFEISKEFVIGYGLDFDGKHRELPYIAQVLA